AYLWTLSATATRRDLHSSPTRRSSDLRITSSNEQTSDLLDEAVTNLTRQIGPSKLRGFILDLRNNPGGLLDQAIAVSDEFMDGRSEEHTSELQSRENLVCRLLLEKKKA